MTKILSTLSATLILGFFFGFFPFRMVAPTVGGTGTSLSGSNSLNSVGVSINTY